MLQNKSFWNATLHRALRTFCQTLVGSLPAGLTITPALIKSLDASYFYVILAWVCTALLAALTSVLTSIVTGLPEVTIESKIGTETVQQNVTSYRVTPEMFDDWSLDDICQVANEMGVADYVLDTDNRDKIVHAICASASQVEQLAAGDYDPNPKERDGKIIFLNTEEDPKPDQEGGDEA